MKQNRKIIEKVNVTKNWFSEKITKLTDLQLDHEKYKDSNYQNQEKRCHCRPREIKKGKYYE